MSDDLFNDLDGWLKKQKDKGYIEEEQTEDEVIVWNIRPDGTRYQLFPPLPKPPPRQYRSYEISWIPFYMMAGCIVAALSGKREFIELIAIMIFWLPWVIVHGGIILVNILMKILQ